VERSAPLGLKKVGSLEEENGGRRGAPISLNVEVGGGRNPLNDQKLFETMSLPKKKGHERGGRKGRKGDPDR